MLKPWYKIPLLYLDEPLISLPSSLFCLKPHAYDSLGAPYGSTSSPWMLRSEVVKRLLLAQDSLQLFNSGLCLAIFDGWRPIRVQKFMYEHAIHKECISRGIRQIEMANSSDMRLVIDVVNKFWALPSLDTSTPPPHSTGGAIDLTLANEDGSPLNMGGEIDWIGPESTPNYYFDLQKSKQNSSTLLWQSRRKLLFDIMTNAGFVQHPNEWWHFSFGDQLWAWSKNLKEAFYGSVDVL